MLKNQSHTQLRKKTPVTGILCGNFVKIVAQSHFRWRDNGPNIILTDTVLYYYSWDISLNKTIKTAELGVIIKMKNKLK